MVRSRPILLNEAVESRRRNLAAVHSQIFLTCPTKGRRDVLRLTQEIDSTPHQYIPADIGRTDYRSPDVGPAEKPETEIIHPA